MLQVDDEIRQKGSTKDMIFKIPFLISHISSIMTLFEGDVILTGTALTPRLSHIFVPLVDETISLVNISLGGLEEMNISFYLN